MAEILLGRLQFPAMSSSSRDVAVIKINVFVSTCIYLCYPSWLAIQLSINVSGLPICVPYCTPNGSTSNPGNAVCPGACSIFQRVVISHMHQPHGHPLTDIMLTLQGSKVQSPRFAKACALERQKAKVKYINFMYLAIKHVDLQLMVAYPLYHHYLQCFKVT